MRNRRSHPRSQFIAAGVTLAAVVLLLAPLRQGPSDMRTQHASFIPLLGSSGVAESASFRRLASVRSANASHQPQVRAPRQQARTPARPVAPAQPLAHDFSAPRIRWQHLDASLRASLDRLAAQAAGCQSLVLHGSQVSTERQMKRLHRLVRGQAEGLPYHIVIGDRIHIHEEVSMAKGESALQLCLTGDFHANTPSASRLAALDEVLDYLAMKLGALPLRIHSRTCIGEAFPDASLIQATR